MPFFFTSVWDAEWLKTHHTVQYDSVQHFWFMHSFEWRRIIYIHNHIVHPFKSCNTSAHTDPQQPSNHIQDICSCWVIWCHQRSWLYFFLLYCFSSRPSITHLQSSTPGSGPVQPQFDLLATEQHPRSTWGLMALLQGHWSSGHKATESANL